MGGLVLAMTGLGAATLAKTAEKSPHFLVISGLWG
jgi:hypothetical protein